MATMGISSELTAYKWASLRQSLLPFLKPALQERTFGPEFIRCEGRMTATTVWFRLSCRRREICYENGPGSRNSRRTSTQSCPEEQCHEQFKAHHLGLKHMHSAHVFGHARCTLQ